MKNPIAFFFSKEAPEGYVPNRNLLCYSAALTGQNMAYAFVTGWLSYFMINILHIDPYYVGVITSVTKVWDSVNDPLMGALVDRHRFKSGEKLRPYHLYLPPIIGVLSVLMFVNVGLSTTGIIIYITICFLIWEMFYNFQDVALWGMVAMSSPHSEERARVAQWVSIGALLGGTVLMQIIPLIKGDGENPGLFGLSERQMFFAIAVVFGLIGELISMLAYNMKEQVHAEIPKESIWQSLFVIRHNKTLLIISLARFLMSLSLKLPEIYFFESSVSFSIGNSVIDGGQALFFYNIIQGIPAALSIFFATQFARKVGGMKRLLLVAQVLAISLRIIAFFVGFNSLPQIIVVMLLMSIMNIPGGMKDIAHRALTSDSIDEVELKTGQRTEGISFSIQNFISKITNAVSLFITGLLLRILKYDSYVPKKEQNATYMKWQWPMFMLGPVIGETLYLIVISFIKEDKEKRKETERILQERREEARKQKSGVEVK